MAERGYNPSSLAHACGLAPSSVHRLLAGSEPRAATLTALAIALGTTIYDLTGLEAGEDRRPPKMVANKRIPLLQAQDAMAFCSDDEDVVDNSITSPSTGITWIPGTPGEQLNHRISFCVTAEDDALHPDIKKGDYLYFKRLSDMSELRGGQVVLACTDAFNGESETVVRYAFHGRDGVYLKAAEGMQSLFPSIYQAFDDSEPIKILGVLVARLSAV